MSKIYIADKPTLDEVKGKVDSIDTKSDSLSTRVNNISTKLDTVDAKIDTAAARPIDSFSSATAMSKFVVTSGATNVNSFTAVHQVTGSGYFYGAYFSPYNVTSSPGQYTVTGRLVIDNIIMDTSTCVATSASVTSSGVVVSGYATTEGSAVPLMNTPSGPINVHQNIIYRALSGSSAVAGYCTLPKPIRFNNNLTIFIQGSDLSVAQRWGLVYVLD